MSHVHLQIALIRRLMEEIGLPDPCHIEKCEFRSFYNTVYILTFHPDPALAPAPATETDGKTKLYLRVNLPCFQNLVATEVATLRYLAQNTTIPVPLVLRSDATTNNVLGQEYTLLVKTGGLRVDSVWSAVTPENKRLLVAQLADFARQLNALPWDSIGSIQEDEDGQFVIGKYLDAHCWGVIFSSRPGFTPQVSVGSVQIGGPFQDFSSFSAAMIKYCVFVMENHRDLAWLHDLVPRMKALSNFLENDRARVEELRLNDMKHVLCHTKSHFGNVMWDPSSGRITGILNWQWSMVCPASMWNDGEFLSNNTFCDDFEEERREMMSMFDEECVAKDIPVRQDAKLNEHQSNVRKV